MKSKASRIYCLLTELAAEDAVSTGLLAYKLISQTINRIEDAAWGADHWYPPRSFLQAPTTDRLYPTSYDSMFPVPDWPHITMLLHIREIIFISAGGAFQIQRKISDPIVPYCDRKNQILLDKADAAGGHVWDR